MKKKLINVFFYNEWAPSFTNSVEKKENKEQKESKSKNGIVEKLEKVVGKLNDNVKNFFGLEKTDASYRLSVTENGLNFHFWDKKNWKDFSVSKETLKKINDLANEGGLDFVFKFKVDLVNNIMISDTIIAMRKNWNKDLDKKLQLINDSLANLNKEELWDLAQNSYFLNNVLKDHSKLSILINFIVDAYTNSNWQFKDSDFIDLVKIYEKYMFKWKTEEEKKFLFFKFVQDLGKGWSNLDIYKTDFFKQFHNKIKKIPIGNEGEQSNEELITPLEFWLLEDKFWISEITQYIDPNEPVIPINFNKLSDYSTEISEYIDSKKELLKWKLSINDLIIISLMLDNNIAELKKYFPSNLDKKLQEISKKFGFGNFNELRADIVEKNIYIFETTDSKLKDSLIRVLKNIPLPLNIIDEVSWYIISLDYFLQKWKENGFRRDKEKFLDLLLNIPEKYRKVILEKIIDPYINSRLKDEEKIWEKDIENTYKRKLRSLYLIMEGLEWGENIDELADLFIWKLKSKDISISNPKEFKEKFKNLLSPENIAELEKEFANYKWSVMNFFIEKVFADGWLWQYFIFPNKHSKASGDKKMQVVNILLEVLENKFKVEKTLKEIDSVEKNKDFLNYFDKAFDKIFWKKWDITSAERVKRDLLKIKLETILLKYVPKNWVLTKEIIEKNKQKILKLLEEELPGNLKRVNEKIEGNKNISSKNNTAMQYLSKLEAVLNNFIDFMPDEWLKFDKKGLDDIERLNNFIKSIEKDRELYQKLGYEWYIRYYEQVEAEKKLVETQKDKVSVDTVSIKESPFSNEPGDPNKLSTKFEKEAWLYKLYVRMPDSKNKKDEILEIKWLDIEAVNKRALEEYIKRTYDFNIEFKWNSDYLNKLVSNDTNIVEDPIIPEDFLHVNEKFINILYHNFYVNWFKQEKEFLRKNNLEDPYLLYTDTKEFFSKLVEWLKKESIWWITPNFDKFTINLDEVSPELLDLNKAKQTKEKILDKWPEKKIWFIGKIGEVWEKISDILKKTKIDSLKKV